MKGFFFISLSFVAPICFSQQQDSLKTNEIETIYFTKTSPVAKSIISVEKEIDAKNLGQDLPILLKNQIAVLSTSDAGNGIGYTGFRIRGVGGSSINVMMNGVPYNDAESQNTFFVDVPDLASSSTQIIIQRGVGTSSNGVAAFGASVNVISKDPSQDFYVKSDNSYGSFNSYKYSAEIGSGKLWNNKLSFLGRYTWLHSDGYVDRAFSDLESYYFAAKYEQNNTVLKWLVFGGNEKTYQSWNGIDKATLQTNPTYNFSGAIYDDNWEHIIGFYDNETDNYRQNHYQFFWQQYFNKGWTLETTLHYTKGKGYYENYKQDADFSKYNLQNIIVDGEEISYTDFIRRKWLDNDFYGVVSTLTGNLGKLKLNFGAVANQYIGRHFGAVSAVDFTEIKDHEYYRNTSTKNELSTFTKGILQLGNWELFGDLQLRNIDYETKIKLQGDEEGKNLSKNWLFFNPKMGISYKIPSGEIYLSYAHAKREPNRDDLFANQDSRVEKLHDFESGIQQSFGNFAFGLHAYYMVYKDQLVLSGLINDVGDYIRQNVDDSYRLGLEVEFSTHILEKLKLSGNATLSKNRIKKIDAVVDDYPVQIHNTPIAFSPSILANAMITFYPSSNFSLGFQNQYVGKQFLDNTNNSDYMLKNFFLTDFNARYRVNISKLNVDFKFLLNNIFNKKYVNNGYVYGNAPYYFPQAGINFMFGMSILFK